MLKVCHWKKRKEEDEEKGRGGTKGFCYRCLCLLLLASLDKLDLNKWQSKIRLGSLGRTFQYPPFWIGVENIRKTVWNWRCDKQRSTKLKMDMCAKSLERETETQRNSKA
ncbi:uncharacterized protein LOC131995197 [Stomoxys calcitrans]|uniref:uncharacterized protein LOC131995197 n=1 Tax=Stomoxys calcitrans TaxID=35570 RepID=UPI0027E2AE8B|nr:uncharacterized protein LOC131995197 [Stomoxys calcitrans]